MAATKYEDLMPGRSKQSLAKDTRDPERRIAAFPAFKERLVKEIDIVDEKIEGNKAIVHAVAKHMHGDEVEPATGEIELIWEDGAWKILDDTWYSKTKIK
jgi:hypothetical protein